jgi:ER membrane protein complex subunit 1
MRLPRIFLALLLTALPAPTAALHESEVGIVDWHKPLVGVPLIGSPNTAPLFHRFTVDQGVTKSVVVTATGSNVLAAIDPVDGSVCAFYF